MNRSITLVFMLAIPSGCSATAASVPAGAGDAAVAEVGADSGCGEELSGQTTVLAAGQTYVTQLALDHDNVYFLFNGTCDPAELRRGGVRRVPKCGGAVERVASAQNWPAGLAVAGDWVFFTTLAGQDGLDDYPATAAAVRSTGWQVSSLGPAYSPGPMVTDGIDLFWFDSLRLMHALADGQPGAEWAQTCPEGAVELALDSDAVYWVSDTQVGAVRRSDGTTTVLADGQLRAADVTVDATDVYWVDYGSYSNSYADGSVRRVPKGGGETVVLAADQDSPGSIAIDSTNVYWTSHNRGRVLALPRSGGSPAVIADGLTTPDSLVVDDTNLYFSEWGSGRIVKLHK